MEVSRVGIVLVVDGERKLLGTITDGDFRRAMHANFDLAKMTYHLLEMKGGGQPPTLIRSLAGTEIRQ